MDISSMELEYKPDAARALKRIVAFWQGEILDRPLINITAPNGRKPRFIPPPETMEKKVLDFEHRIEVEEENIRCTYYGGEAFPTIWADFGTSFTAACLGGELKIADADPALPVMGNIWSEPVIKDWERHFEKIRFMPDNRWLKLGIEFIRLVRERGRGKYFLMAPCTGGGADTCADLRGTEAMCLDLYDHPEWLRRLLEVVRLANAEIVRRLYQEIVPFQGGFIMPYWDGAWAPGLSGSMQNDIGYSISPALLRDFFLEPMIKESEVFDHVIFHTHREDYAVNRQGRLAWLEVVLAIPRVQVIQWNWQDFKKIIDAGKYLLVRVDAGKIPAIMEALGPEYLRRTWLHCSPVQSREEADSIIKMLSRK